MRTNWRSLFVYIVREFAAANGSGLDYLRFADLLTATVVRIPEVEHRSTACTGNKKMLASLFAAYIPRIAAVKG